MKNLTGDRFRSVLLVILCLITVFAVAGCTRVYEPISEWEQTEFDKANRNVYPDDVRENVDLYKTTTVAWTGLIKQVEVVQTNEGPDVIYLLEHHYYDWIEDFGAQSEHIFLSPRGEGDFMTTWELSKDTTAAELEDITDATHLLIVYGLPLSIEGDRIILDASYVRGIDRRYYTTEKMDYGRLD